MSRPRPLSKLTTNPFPKKSKKVSSNPIFGPNLKESKPLQVKCGHIKKLIHYDSKKQNDSEDDIPDENEVYVKENLLQNTTEENDNNSPDDDFSIVNINMSRLLSLSNSNSKNTSYNANASKDNNKEKQNPKELIKKNNGSFNKSKGGEISSGNGSIESNNPNNITNNNNSNSNNTYSNSNNSNNVSNNNNNGHLSKNSITAKRKKFYDKLMKKKEKVNNINDDKNKIFETNQFDALKNLPNNNSASNNIKITNNTNIILNVKSGTKSLDIRALNNNTNNDIMMRDLRKLHIITQKAICSISNINPIFDTFDNFTEANRQRNYSNNKVLNNKRPIKELLINDNTDYGGFNQLLINNYTIDKKYDYINNPNININFNNNKPTSSQIINIININGGNYSMDQTKKIILKNIPRSDLASIKETPYETQYIKKPTYIQRKGVKNKQYEFDSNTYKNIKKGKTKVNKINDLPNKKFSHTNWHGNTINAVSTKNECGNNKGIKKYIEHLRKSNKGNTSNNNCNYEKNIFIENDKIKIK